MIDALTIDQSRVRALRAYTGADYSSVNRLLRYNHSLDAHHLEIIEQLDAAMEVTSLPNSILVYRGVGPRVLGLKYGEPFDFYAAVGMGIVDPGFVSSTTDIEVARNFGDVVMEIMVPAGTRALCVAEVLNNDEDTINELGSESEVILDRGLKYRVDSVGGTESNPLLRVSILPG